LNVSAGILLYRAVAGVTQVLLAHPGGPYWRRKDLGAWSIPKGEIGEGEELLAAALREFAEETGTVLDGSAVLHHGIPLGDVRQSGGKRVIAFAFAQDFDPAAMRSITFEMEWPPRSGRLQHFPEVDRVAWFGPEEAERKMLASQRPFLRRLDALLAGR
jgi:predicted NUDIX family NTP pyrophosphohydrolase